MLVGLLVLGLIAGLESASFLAIGIRDGRLTFPSQWQREREAAALQTGEPVVSGGPIRGIEAGGMQVIHPFLGFVLNPDFTAIEWRDITPHGFQRPRDEVDPPAGAPRFVVAMFGGSLSGGICMRTRDVLLRELQRAASIQGKSVVIRCLAMGGYKQPQQLMALTHALSLGEAIDVAINVDGFNEVALPIAENLRQGTYPFYPRGWAGRVIGAPSLDALRTVGRITLRKDERRRGTGLCAARPLAWSPTCHLVWTTRDRWLARQVFEGERALIGLMSADRSFLSRGPAFAEMPRRPLCHVLAEHWARSSTLMFDLARARGIRYVHFLQPNQYLPGSKPMSRDERLAAIDPMSPYKLPVEDCYPSLIEFGKALTDRGVPFHDLTGVFASHPEPLYDDTCCHPNQAGYRLLTELIGRRTVAALGSP